MTPNRKRLWLMLVSASALLLMPCGAWAYAEEVHFNLTYVLCRYAGLSDLDALWVADADQSMDTNGQTSAFLNAPYWLAHRDRSYFNGAYFHDFSDIAKVAGTDQAPYFADLGKPRTIRYTDNGKRARVGIRYRLSVLWKRIPLHAVGERSKIAADIALGQYLHAEQDYFSHRQFTPYYLVPGNSDTDVFPVNSFIPYGPYAGHANDGDAHCADYVVWRPALACLMVQDSYRHICRYAQTSHTNSAPCQVVAPKYLNTLVQALAGTYVISRNKNSTEVHYPNEMPKNYDTKLSLQEDYKTWPPTLQPKINNALEAALALIPVPSEWRSELPENDEKCMLPFDHPETPLSIVISRIKSLSKVPVPYQP